MPADCITTKSVTTLRESASLRMASLHPASLRSRELTRKRGSGRAFAKRHFAPSGRFLYPEPPHVCLCSLDVLADCAIWVPRGHGTIVTEDVDRLWFWTCGPHVNPLAVGHSVPLTVTTTWNLQLEP